MLQPNALFLRTFTRLRHLPHSCLNILEDGFYETSSPPVERNTTYKVAVILIVEKPLLFLYIPPSHTLSTFQRLQTQLQIYPIYFTYLTDMCGHFPPFSVEYGYSSFILQATNGTRRWIEKTSKVSRSLGIQLISVLIVPLQSSKNLCTLLRVGSKEVGHIPIQQCPDKPRKRKHHTKK